MYSFDQVKRGIRNPSLIGRELNKLYHTRGKKSDYNRRGIDVFEEEWDNLIILDACRYDMFSDAYEGEGDLESRESRGSSTIEFLRGNFDGRGLTDTIYITANPQLEWNRDQVEVDFFRVFNLWNRDEYWDQEYNTVRPEEVTSKALEVMEKYPEKRLLIHYMQPHFPFLPPEDSDVEKMGLEDHFWQGKMEGRLDISKEETWDMYHGNLRVALEAVYDLLEEIEGLTVISSDHGNFVGERSSPVPVREWGHPIGVYDDILTKVPWLVLEKERREISSEENVDSGDEEDDVDEEEIKDKLESLGYGG